jgi:hypothetical protein
MAVVSKHFQAELDAALAELRREAADIYRRGFAAGRDYELWADRCSEGDGSIRPDTRNPYDGRDETDLDGDDDEGGTP